MFKDLTGVIANKNQSPAWFFFRAVNPNSQLSVNGPQHSGVLEPNIVFGCTVTGMESKEIHRFWKQWGLPMSATHGLAAMACAISQKQSYTQLWLYMQL